MKHGLSRRDFLKLAGILPLGIMAPPLIQKFGIGQPLQGDRKNVLIIVFDALSAYNISLYGYSRETMPNLTRLAQRATVYHNHFAGGNYTTPGTASLLTGTLPWSHRAIRFNGKVRESFANKSIFHAFDDYYSFAYSHNTLVNTLFGQFLSDINEYIPQEKLLLFNDGLIRDLFKADEDIATVGWARSMKRAEGGYSYSLFLSHLYEKYRDNKVSDVKKLFPYGLPNVNSDNYFTLEQAVDWMGANLNTLPQPFLGYFHFLPPHFPYKPRQDFAGQFTNDSWKAINKPDDLFTEDRSYEFLSKWRVYYDEFILYVDSEFSRLFNMLESTGVLDNTVLVLTSDHGEMFERGIWNHSTATLYQPVIRVPLLIFEPGQQIRQDIHAATSAIDLMPTLLQITGHKIPDWAEGSIIPPYQDLIRQPKKSIHAVEAKHNDPNAPFTEATTMLIEENFKLVYYFGYNNILGTTGERIQLFDIKDDPEELKDLSLIRKDIAVDLLGRLKAKLKEVNEPFL